MTFLGSKPVHFPQMIDLFSPNLDRCDCHSLVECHLWAHESFEEIFNFLIVSRVFVKNWWGAELLIKSPRTVNETRNVSIEEKGEIYYTSTAQKSEPGIWNMGWDVCVGWKWYLRELTVNKCVNQIVIKHQI